MGRLRCLSRLGWQVAPWGQITFVGSIIENSTVNCDNGGPSGWHVRGLKPYDGPPLASYDRNGQNAAHDWAAYCYFWVSDAGLARRLDGT